MGGSTNIADPSWPTFENIFNIEVSKTPPMEYHALEIPKAPKKVNFKSVQRDGLRPRKLTYEDEDGIREKEKRDKSREDSGIGLWANSSAALRIEDVDKENRLESGKRHKCKGKVHVKSDDKVCDRGRKEAVSKSDFRSFRI